MKFSENETLELKKSTAQLKNAIISITSILNKHGHGELFISGSKMMEPSLARMSVKKP